ncbi:MAG: TatD family hydrolase [Candidatus Cryptobacteroides sp.]|nr:TatD family hydrolase [Candidatus Cryptobacteroides sp.]
MYTFIDTHCHFNDASFASDAADAIQRAVDAGVGIMLQADIDSSERESMFALVDSHSGHLRPMLGLYPGSVRSNWMDEIDALSPWKSRSDIVAIGEIGLDYHYGTEWKAQQQDAFKVQLEIACSMGLPVNIHLRDATDDFFRVLDSCKGLPLRGNLHAFSGSIETFRRLEAYGDWYVGIGGVLTFKNASIARVVRDIPLERILLETDAPYLAPTPHRGQRNEPSMIPLIAGFLASVKGTSIEEVARVTTSNAKALFNL